jgi:hypothetical protein
MLLQLTTEHKEFLYRVDGLIWKEVTKEQADRMLGKDVDTILKLDLNRGRLYRSVQLFNRRNENHFFKINEYIQ